LFDSVQRLIKPFAAIGIILCVEGVIFLGEPPAILFCKERYSVLEFAVMVKGYAHPVTGFQH
jgi:hypothetical protein